jgi:hypothetical protein
MSSVVLDRRPTVALFTDHRLTVGTQESLKLLAMVLMVVGHSAFLWLDGDAYVWARVAGRLVFPVFALLTAYNLSVRGVAPRRYLLPLLVLAIVSEPFYQLALGMTGNIIWATLGGVVLVGLWDRTLEPRRWYLAGLLVYLPLAYLFVGFGLAGVFLVPAFVLAIRYSVAASHLLLAVLLVSLNPWHPGMLVPLLALPLFLLAARVDIPMRRMPRWLWSAFYPAHLAIVAFVAMLTGV